MYLEVILSVQGRCSAFTDRFIADLLAFNIHYRAKCVESIYPPARGVQETTDSPAGTTYTHLHLYHGQNGFLFRKTLPQEGILSVLLL